MENLLEFKKNIISWYPILKGKKVLQLGNNEEIFEELKLKTEMVVKEDSLKDIKDSFDYIVLIGNLDNCEEKDLSDTLNIAKTHLNQNGKILLSIKNKFGMKYFAGEKINNNSSFESIINNLKGVFGYSKLQKILDNLNLKYKFYYPLSDNEYTNVIFTDEILPSQDSIDARDVNLCNEEDFIVFSERDAFKQLLLENKDLFKYFANSYFIEIGNDDNFEKIRYVSFGITRKKEYRLRTIIYENEVLKYADNVESERHLDTISNNIDILNGVGLNLLDKKDGNTIISKYLENAKSFDEILIDIYKKGGLDALIEKIEFYRENIINKLPISEVQNTIFDKYEVKMDDSLNQNLHYTKDGVLDLIFQNTLVDDEQKLYVYDQEWYEENVPLEFILYRALFYFTELKNSIDINIVYEKLGLIELKDVFEELETKIQNSIKDLDIWNMHLMTNKNVSGVTNILDNYKKQIEEANKHAEELDDVIQKYLLQIEELNHRIEEKDVQLNDYANELRAIANSVSWKITKPIRAISSKLHGKK